MPDSDYSVQVSNLFAPVQTLGLVTDGNAVAVYHLGSEGFLASSVGNSFHVFDLKKLQIKLRSLILPYEISSILGSNTGHGRIFVALDVVHEIRIFDRLLEVGKLISHRYRIIGLLALGSILISWSKWEVLIWDFEKSQLIGTLETPRDEDIGEISSVIHPETYLNKILVGYRHGGELQLWNIRSLKKIHSFKSIQSKESLLDLSVGITAMSLSIHPNVVAIGYSNGLLRLLDIEKDQVLCELHHSTQQGAVRMISFRSDSDCSTPGVFITGCENGDIIIWDTTDSRMLHSIESAHQPDCGVSFLRCLPNEPLMVSSGKDNSIILWIFDGIEEQPRILRQRQGMPSPVERIEVYDDQGKDLLTFGTFNRRCFLGRTSSIQQQQDCQFAQKKSLRSITQKWRVSISQLPPAVDIAHAFSRHYDWPNIATCHEGLNKVFLWSGHDRALVSRIIELPPATSRATNIKAQAPVGKTPNPTALAISICGNYIVVGYTDGTVHRFNLQSGAYRGPFLRSLKQQAHEGPIARIEIIGSFEVLSASSVQNDCVLRKWDLHSHKLISEMSLGPMSNSNAPLSGFNSVQTFTSLGVLTAVVLSTFEANVRKLIHEDNNSLTTASTEQICQRSSKVIIIDFQTKSIVREFAPILNDYIISIALSRDMRWIIISTLIQPYLYVYDILSSSLIDWIQLRSSALSIAFDYSNSFVYLGLRHLKGGIFVVANKHIFDPTVIAPLLSPAPMKPIAIGDRLPHESHNDDAELDCENVDEARSEFERRAIESVFSEEQLEPKKLTLSGQSEGRLQAIFHLERIRERNAPRKPDQAVADAPFFLPTVYEGKEMKFAIPSIEGDETAQRAADFFSGVQNSDVENPKKPTNLIGKSILQEYLRELKDVMVKLTETEPMKRKHRCQLEGQRIATISKIMNYLKQLSPSGIHLVLTDLGMLSGANDEELELMVEFFCDCVQSRKDADFVQCLLHVFIEAHCETLTEMASQGLGVDAKNREEAHHDIDLINGTEEILGDPRRKKNRKRKKGEQQQPTHESDTDQNNIIMKKTFREKLTTLRDCLKSDWIPLDLQCHQLSCCLKFLTHSQIE